MKKLATGMLAVWLLSIGPALAAETQKQPAATKESAGSKTAEKKKAPGTMDKAGNSVKSGWNRFTKSFKQGRKQPTCSAEQKSLRQCE